MKRICSNHKSIRRFRGEATGNGSARKGAFFHYVLIYMTVAAALMTTAGVCLHSILKADASERRESLFLNSMMRAEHQLRVDSQSSGFVCDSATAIVVQSPEQTNIRWAADQSFLTRSETRGDEAVSSDRFIFPAGSQISMQEGPENSVVIRITEPSAFVTYSELANGGSNRSKPAEEATPATPAHVAQPNFAEIHLRGAKP